MLGRAVRLNTAVRISRSGRRNDLFRVQDESVSETLSFVIKRVVSSEYDPTDLSSWDTKRFLNDWAGVAFLSALGQADSVGPRLFGGDTRLGFIVLEDLESDKTLADHLLGSDAGQANDALISYAACVGQLHAASRGRRKEFDGLYSSISGHRGPAPELRTPFSERLEQVRAGVTALGLQIDRQVQSEWELIQGDISRPGPFDVLLHGDPCPDNVLMTNAGVRLVDFEATGFGHALKDAAYPRMMFPTCWCAGNTPRSVIAEAELAYRTQLSRNCVEAQDDQLFAAALVGQCGFWLLNTLGAHLEEVVREDRTWGIASVRSRIISRLEAFTAAGAEFERMPAMQRLAEQLLKVLRIRWPETEALISFAAFGPETGGARQA